MEVLWKMVAGRPGIAVSMLAVLTIAGCGGNSSTTNATATPSFSPAGGSYNTSQTVTVSDATPGAVLYCTTDGTTPTTSSTPCPQPITVFKTEYLQAIAVAPGKSASSVASAGYTIDLKAAATPTFSPAGATYVSAQTVTIASATAGANIFYTTDGSIPTTASTLYAGPVTVSTSQTLTAIAMAAGYTNSGTVAATYTIQPVVSAPTVSGLSPNSVPPGDAGFTLTVYGANFIPGATVLWNSTANSSSSASTAAPIRNIAFRSANLVSREDTQSSGTALTTTFVSSTELQAAVPASLVTAAGSITVSVTDSEGSSSGSTPTGSTFAVGAPTIASIFPASVVSGSAGFALAVNGTNFASGATVLWGSTPLTTTLANSTQLMAAVPASLITTSGTATVTVTDSAGTSSGATFTVTTASPTITNLSPASATAGGAGFTLTVNGSNFDSSVKVSWNGTALTTSLVSAGQITAAVPGNLIASAGTASITVSTTAGTSGASIFTIQSGTPAITGLNPTTATAGGAAFTLTVNGSNFDSSAKVNWNGSALSTSFVNAGQVTAAVPANSIATAGSASITVTTTAGTSSASSFTVQAAAPTITSFSPTSATVGGSAFQLTVNGTNFDSSTKVNWNGVALPTTYVNGTTVTANIPRSLITSTGTANITVTTNAGTSAVSTFAIQLGAPTITTINPTSVTVGGPDFILTVNGSNFDSSAVVKWGGTALGATLVSSTQVTASVPANLIATIGTANITVSTSAGTSSATSLAIQQAGVPTISNLDPASVTAGGLNFLLKVNGTGFDSGSVVKWNGAALTTIYASSTELQATITADLISSGGTVRVTVSGTGGTSAASSFIIKLGAPTITGFDPANANSNDPAFTTLMVNGTNFDSSAVVTWNNTPLSTTYVNAGQITAAIPASLIASPGTASITVTTTAGVSAASNFTVNLGKPAISNIDPTSVIAGGSSFTLKVTGTNFDSSAKINWNGNALTPTPVSTTEIDANIDSSLITTAGSATITVTNSAGTSDNSFTLTINAATPSIISLTPNSGAVGNTVVIAGSNFGASQGTSTVTFGTMTATVTSGNWSNNSITTTVPAGATGTVAVAVTVNGVKSNTDKTFTVTVTLPTISGVVSSAGASVQLYAAGTSGYGSGASGPTKVDGSAATSDPTTGHFSGIAYDCSKLKAPDDQLYLIATGTNNQVVLMTALGSCGNLSTSGTTVTINEVTTIASVYALSAFAEASTTGVGIDIGAPATYDAAKAPKCDSNDGWLSTGKETCNYTGLVNAFKAVNNLVDIASGTARSYTPDYTQTLSSDSAVVNNSTVPTARINALADMLAAGGSLLPVAKPAGGTQPNDTLQAALDIAQNPGNNVSALLGLVASQANPPYSTTLHLSGGSAPTDLTLALTFTGAGLGIAPGTTSPTPVVNNAMAIDAAGDVWVVGTTGSQSSLIAEFSNSGKPITSPSTPSAHGGYQPGSNWNLYSVSSIAIDPSGSLWIGGSGSGISDNTVQIVGLTEIFPDLSGSSSPILQPGLFTYRDVTSVAIDGKGNVWAGETAGFDEYGNGGTILSPHDANGIPTGGFGIGEQSSDGTLGAEGNLSMLFDSNGYLWAENNVTTYDLDLFNISANAVNVVTVPYFGSALDPAVPASTGSIVYDAYYNYFTYNTTSNGTMFGEYSPVAADGSGNIYGCGSGGGDAATAAVYAMSGYTPPDGNGNGGYLQYAGPIGYGSGTGYLDVNNAASLFSVGFSNPFAVSTQYAFPATYVATGRGCGGGQTGGGKMVIDGLGHIFALSGGTGSSDPAGTTTLGLPGIIDEFTTVGVDPGDPTNPNSVTMLSPAATGYTGTSSGEPTAINPDPAVTPMTFNQLTGQQTDSSSGIADAAMDGSGNLWVLNADTGPSSTHKGNVLVEYVGIGAPVVTPPSLGLANKSYVVRP